MDIDCDDSSESDDDISIESDGDSIRACDIIYAPHPDVPSPDPVAVRVLTPIELVYAIGMFCFAAPIDERKYAPDRTGTVTKLYAGPSPAMMLPIVVGAFA
jgi:hypothetical protein